MFVSEMLMEVMGRQIFEKPPELERAHRLLGPKLKKKSLQLSPLLLNMFNHSLNQSKLPSSLTQAHITVLLKPDKDALD